MAISGVLLFLSVALIFRLRTRKLGKYAFEISVGKCSSETFSKYLNDVHF